MVDLSKEDLEKLRQLEDEVDRERAAVRARHEPESKDLVEAGSGAPKAEGEGEKALVETGKQTTALAPGYQSRLKMRNWILGGTVAVMAVGFVITNLASLVGMLVVAGGVYFGLNKYFVGGSDEKPDEKKDSPGS